MVRIRLRKGGKKNRPCYRVVVVDSRARRDGRVIENVGYYDPVASPATVNLSVDRIQAWLDKGATMSETVKSLVKKVGMPPREAVRVTPEPEPAEAGEET